MDELQVIQYVPEAQLERKLRDLRRHGRKRAVSESQEEMDEIPMERQKVVDIPQTQPKV
jgi:hypothetical protein